MTNIPMPDNVAANVRKWFFRQAKFDFLVLFFVFSFFGFAIAGFASWFLTQVSPMNSIAVGFTSGLIAGLWVLALELFDWHTIRQELHADYCAEVDAAATRAIYVRMRNGKGNGIALDCGAATLVFVGSWWQNKLRSELWIRPKTQSMFPTNSLKLKYLPDSHRVISVTVSGKELTIQTSESVEPILDIVISKKSEVHVVELPLDQLLLVQRC